MKAGIVATIMAAAVSVAAATSPAEEGAFEKRLAEYLESRDTDVCAGDASCGPGNCEINLGCDTIVDPIGASAGCIACTLSLFSL
ncbi:hypothetical protein BDV11DRAFT_171992 [Aspergillus similis]